MWHTLGTIPESYVYERKSSTYGDENYHRRVLSHALCSTAALQAAVRYNPAPWTDKIQPRQHCMTSHATKKASIVGSSVLAALLMLRMVEKLEGCCIL